MKFLRINDMTQLSIFCPTILESVLECLQNYKWNTLFEIHEYAEKRCAKKINITNVSARIRELRAKGRNIDWRYHVNELGEKTMTSEYLLKGRD